MGNKFLGKSKKSLYTLGVTALLTVLTGVNAYAADDNINIEADGTPEVSTSGAGETTYIYGDNTAGGSDPTTTINIANATQATTIVLGSNAGVATDIKLGAATTLDLAPSAVNVATISGISLAAATNVDLSGGLTINIGNAGAGRDTTVSGNIDLATNLTVGGDVSIILANEDGANVTGNVTLGAAASSTSFHTLTIGASATAFSGDFTSAGNVTMTGASTGAVVLGTNTLKTGGAVGFGDATTASTVGKLDLAGDHTVTTTATAGNVTISDIIASGADANGTLVLQGTGTNAITIATVSGTNSIKEINYAGAGTNTLAINDGDTDAAFTAYVETLDIDEATTVSISSGDTLNVGTALEVAATKTVTVDGAGSLAATAVTVADSATAILDLDNTGTNTITTLTMAGDGVLDGSGAVTVTTLAALVDTKTLTLQGTGNKTITTVTTPADGENATIDVKSTGTNTLGTVTVNQAASTSLTIASSIASDVTTAITTATVTDSTDGATTALVIDNTGAGSTHTVNINSLTLADPDTPATVNAALSVLDGGTTAATEITNVTVGTLTVAASNSGAIETGGHDGTEALNGTVTVTTANVSGTLALDPEASTDIDVGTLNMLGTASTVLVTEQLIDVDKLVVGTDVVATLDLDASDGAGVTVATSTDITGKLTIKENGTTDESSLGAVTISGGTLTLDDSGANQIVLGIDSFTTNTGIATLVGAEAQAHQLKIATAGTGNLTLNTDLIYDSGNAVIVASDGTVVSSANFSTYGTGSGKLLDLNGATNIAAGETKAITESTAFGTVSQNAAGTATVSTTSTTEVTAAVGGATELNNAAAILAIGENVNYVQSVGQFGLAAGTGVGQGTVQLGGKLTILTASGGVKTLTTTSDNAELAGDKAFVVGGDGSNNTLANNLTVSNTAGVTFGGGGSGNLDIDGQKLTVESSLTMATGTSVIADTAGTGEVALAGATTSDGVLTIDGTTNAAKTLSVASDRYGTLTGVAASDKLTVTDLNVDGHLILDSVTLQSTNATVSSNSLEFKSSTWNSTGDSTIGNVTVTSGNAAANKIDFIGTTADQTATISTLNMVAAAASGLTIDSNSAKNSTLTVTTANIGSADNVARTLLLDATSTGTNTVNIGTLNLMGQNGGAATVANAVLDINNSGATAVTVTELNVDAGYGGTIDTLEAVTVTTANIGGDGSVASTLDIDNQAGVVTFDTVNLKGTATKTATLTMKATDVITNLNVAAGKHGTLAGAQSNNITNVTVNGELVTAGAWAPAATSATTVGAAGKLNLTGAMNLTTTAGGTLTVDLGNATSGTRAAGTNDFAEVATSAVTTAAAGADNTIEEVYAQNGISGVTYDDVFAVSMVGAADTNVLNDNDRFVTYTLADTQKDIAVTTDNAGVDSAVTAVGGTSVEQTAMRYLIDNQGTMNSEGQAYVTNMRGLTGDQYKRSLDETTGTEATTQTAQAAQLGVQQSVAAIGRQMTAFRSGSLSNGMTSSFGSGGATAALNDMADAETLADAYDSATGEGYTAAAEGTYKKVQVWANGYGGWGEQGSDGDMVGYDFYNVGVMAGLDYAFAKEFRLGALFGYTYNDTDSYGDRGDSQDNVLRFGGYGSFNWNNFFADMTSSVGIHMIDSKRKLLTNGQTAKGDRTGIDFNVAGTLGYTFMLPADFMITPSYTLSYTMFYDPDYNESGAGAGNLSYDSFTSNSLVQDLGVKAGKLFTVSDTLALLPEVWGGWEVEYLNTGGDRNSTTATSIGSQSYSTSMNGMATHRGYWGAGMTALINDNVSVYGRYDQKIWDKGYNVGFTAGIKVAF